ncbi:MAG: Bax inhibitor-1/YccA family protein [Vallitaleaceae bacterium]|nr:Bax inhibitor-1/YccA family protein [Vallitaleaceae bacterium]
MVYLQHNEPFVIEQVAFNQFLAKVFLWMFVGLGATALSAFTVASTPALFEAIVVNKFVFFGLIIGELVMVGFLVVRIQKMSFTTALGIFLLYSVLNGLTLSVILLVYTAESIAMVFGGTSLIFGIMALYGYFTKTDLSAFRAFFVIGIIGIIVMSLINIFVNSSGLYTLISYAGVGIFAGLTAYDIQKLKGYYYHVAKGNQSEGNLAIIGALNLYLDFINIFLFLLRLLGRSK